MTNKTDSITKNSWPIWLLVVSGFFGLLELLMGLSMAFAPESTLDSIDQSGPDDRLLIQMWAVRQFALGAILAFATIRKSGQMLQLAYFFMMVMFIGDGLVGFSRGEIPTVIGGVIMLCISAGMFWIAKQKSE